jgi:hypothetical protein
MIIDRIAVLQVKDLIAKQTSIVETTVPMTPWLKFPAIQIHFPRVKLLFLAGCKYRTCIWVPKATRYEVFLHRAAS